MPTTAIITAPFKRREFAKRFRTRVDRARKRAQFYLVAIARVDDGDVRIVEQTIPRRCIDVLPRSLRRIDVVAVHSDQFRANADFHSKEHGIVRIGVRMTHRQLRKTQIRFQLLDEPAQRAFTSGQRRIDAFVREQDRAA